MKNKLTLLLILGIGAAGALSFIFDRTNDFFNVGMLLIAVVGLFKLKSEIRSKRRYELACELISAYCIQAENIMKYVYIKDICDKEEFFPVIRESTEKLSDAVNKTNLIFKKYCDAKEYADNLASTGKYIESLIGKKMHMLSKNKMVFAQKLIRDKLSYDDRLELLNKEKQKLMDSLKKYI